MEQEIELKLLVSGDITSVIEAKLIPALSVDVESDQAQLFNRYFDTPDKLLRANGIGFRIRGKNGEFEQTIKTEGRTVGGLHHRPEYNIALTDNQPDLTLFDPAIWPEGLHPEELQQQILPLFSTHFNRQTYILTFADNSCVELVFDQGQVAGEKEQSPICEVELELKQGNPGVLFDIAEKLATLTNVHLGYLSKAARGYMLASGRELEPDENLDFIPLNDNDTVEQGFILAVEYSLGLWLHNQQCYQDTQKLKALGAMVRSMNLMLQAFSLYLPLLQCPALLELHRQLLEMVDKWYWLPSLLSMKSLSSGKGIYAKCPGKQDALNAYLQGRSEGVLLKHAPQEMLDEQAYNRLQLRISRVIMDKPWQQASDTWQSLMADHAKGWLSQDLQNIRLTLPRKRKIKVENYLAAETLLKRNLYNGLLLAGLFPLQHRDQFRGPWLDILDGIEELNTLTLLKSELSRADIEERAEIAQWCDDKMAHLLSVMEQSRKMALKMEPYW